MNRAWAALVVLLGACGPGDDVDERRVAQSRDAIIGGKVSFGDPEVFMIRATSPGGTYYCTSTLIAPRTLLTAAHCVYPEGGVVPTIDVLNAPSMYTALSREYVPALQWHYNDTYDPEKIINDTGIIELEREPFAPTKPINTEPMESYLNFTMRAVGYGVTNRMFFDLGNKRSTPVTLRAILPKQLRVGDMAHGICAGDSGGPAFFTFPDKVERLVGVTSFGAETCGSSIDTDARVDKYTEWIGSWLDQIEGTCASDGKCRLDCQPIDPDCACMNDGVCDNVCSDPTKDPDCPSSCGPDGVCSRTPCATPDPDCAPFGSVCGRDLQCAGRVCAASPQHSLAYCSSTCDDGHPCPSGFECSSGVCRYPLKPEAALGEVCTVGTTWCGDSANVCTFNGESESHCFRRCFEQNDCQHSAKCSVEYKDHAEGVCVPYIALSQLQTISRPAAKSCSAMPGDSMIAGLVFCAVMRRRRRRIIE